MESERLPQGFRALRVYRHALDLSVYTATAVRGLEWGAHFYLRDQLLRSTSSVAANIAEGHSRESTNDAVRFWMIAKSSAAEAAHHLTELRSVGIISMAVADELIARHDMTEAMLRRLILGRRNKAAN